MALHRLDQIARGKGFGDVVVRAQFDALLAFAVASARGQHDDPHVAPVAVRANRAADVIAIAPRDHHVQKHQIGLALGDRGERGIAIGGDAHIETGRRHEKLQRLDDVRLVVDHQDRVGHRLQILPSATTRPAQWFGLDRGGRGTTARLAHSRKPCHGSDTDRRWADSFGHGYRDSRVAGLGFVRSRRPERADRSPSGTSRCAASRSKPSP